MIYTATKTNIEFDGITIASDGHCRIPPSTVGYRRSTEAFRNNKKMKQENKTWKWTNTYSVLSYVSKPHWSPQRLWALLEAYRLRGEQSSLYVGNSLTIAFDGLYANILQRVLEGFYSAPVFPILETYSSVFTINGYERVLHAFSSATLGFFSGARGRVARVTTFTVAYKAFGGEASVPLLGLFSPLALLVIGLITDFRHGQGSFAYPYPYEPFDEDLWNRLSSPYFVALDFSGEMDFRNFMKKPGQSPSFSVRPTDQPVDVGSPSVEPLWSIADNDHAESSSLSKDKGVSCFELAVVGEGILGQSASVVGEGSKTGAPLRSPLKKKLPCFDELVDVFDVYALQTEEVRNMSTNKSRIMSQGHSKLKNDLVSLKSKKSLLEHEMSKLEDRLAKAQRNHDIEGSQVVKDLRSKNARILEEVWMLRILSSKLEAASLEKAKFVKDFLPSMVKKLMETRSGVE
ncbi:hypothetical protein Tco_0410077 [Tanacetum coccineum]